MAAIKTNFKYKNPLVKLNLNKVIYIVLHHTECLTATPEQIHEWHLANLWSGFGYNAYIRKNGDTYIGRGLNIGAHCLGYNELGYGICFEGNFNEESLTSAQMAAGVQHINEVKANFKNFQALKKHSDLVATSCPGKNFDFNFFVNATSDTFITDLQRLQNIGVMKSADYWKEHAIAGQQCEGSYVKQLIQNFSQYVTK